VRGGESLRDVSTCAGLMWILALSPQTAQPPGFWEDFHAGWNDRWMERALDSRHTRYEVVQEGAGAVLRATSEKSASVLWHKLDTRPLGAGRISWRWRVQTSLSQNVHERDKRGDDYAARLFVLFDSSRLSPATQAICYVWAAHEAVGATYRSPYARGVAMIVVESGDERAGEWLAEGRDFEADYRAVFRRAPKAVSAVAIMVDTDDTGSRGTAWFDDIGVVSREPQSGLREPEVAPVPQR